MEADSLVLALGQDVDLGLLDGVPGLELIDGVVKVAPNMMTGHPGIFAGGDMVPAERNVTVAIGHGKKAARHIDAWLRNATVEAPKKHEVATFEQLNTWYYSEARRCLSCGNCFECDNCYGVCPDNAVIKLGAGKRFEFNYDYCKGCGICAAECPCGAIVMEPEKL